jgi:hypothetical protein
MQMVSNVSKDIQSRIDGGEVNQEQLMKESTDLLQSRRGGGLEGMMKMMGGGGGIAEMMKMMVRVSDQPKTTTLLHLFPASKKGKR